MNALSCRETVDHQVLTVTPDNGDPRENRDPPETMAMPATMARKVTKVMLVLLGSQESRETGGCPATPDLPDLLVPRGQGGGLACLENLAGKEGLGETVLPVEGDLMDPLAAM